MSQGIFELLKNHWGHKTFRPKQEEIITSVLEGRDTMALLPTGGGKSICFQIPVLAQKGMGLVISPLIALMADQVQNLKKRGISAFALSSGLSYKEIDIALDHCVAGRYKFLYLSPERLQSEIVQERLARCTVNLIAVDEAHCISQWGYDFRPPYLEVAKIRSLWEDVPVLALTATATPAVVSDIQEKLLFEEPNVIQKSFYRDNLFYSLSKTEQKWQQTLAILDRLKGSSIIYMRNRRSTVEVSQWLNQRGHRSDFYHAGVAQDQRDQKLKDWLQGKTRIMVCTNAFGMGIDKGDVQSVIHLELPDSLEAYFQEAGRAGRNGQEAHSVILCGPSDINSLKERYLNNFPDQAFISKVYECLGNYLNLAIGSMGEGSYPFDLNDFAKRYNLPRLKVFHALSIMEKEGLLNFNEAFRRPSRVMLKTDRNSLYDYQLRNPNADVFIKTLMRSYGGLDIEYVKINEYSLASRMRTAVEDIKKMLFHLHKQGILDYIPQTDGAEISLTASRMQSKYLRISDQNLKDRKIDLEKRIGAMVDYVENETMCRSRKLLEYFGETTSEDCGGCDVCRKRKTREIKASEYDEIVLQIKKLLESRKSIHLQELQLQLELSAGQLSEVLRTLTDESRAFVVDKGMIRLTEQPR